ncbi:TetR/AcrR family transcriptional regulator [Amycolatopsis echigonensis]|uniref:TetR/AcrR family transcriptional regulator n=1 Tax=Amycolatopsis echigonensis TaxID=2576905 RepID=UPI001FCA3D1B|nr:TetR/AcrR family transcriptional regulator [Amycolatopsis niigatensis]
MPDAPRRTRRDALENRARLLEVAAQAFAEQGLDAAPAAIAKQAGVGVGTLYRHFPTREALVDAAYRHQLAGVCEQAPALLAQYPAAEAMRAWLRRFLAYVSAKHGMSEALTTVIASGVDPFSTAGSCSSTPSANCSRPTRKTARSGPRCPSKTSCS